MKKNKYLAIVALVILFSLSVVPIVSGAIYGNGDYSGVSWRPDSDQFHGGKFTFVTSGTDTNLSYVQFYGVRYGANSYVKACLVLDSVDNWVLLPDNFKKRSKCKLQSEMSDDELEDMWSAYNANG